MKPAWLLTAVLALAAGCASTGANQVMGTKPTYLESSTDNIPNAAALGHRIWTPSLDDDIGKLE